MYSHAEIGARCESTKTNKQKIFLCHVNKKELEITAVDVNTNTTVLLGESCYSTVNLGTPLK